VIHLTEVANAPKEKEVQIIKGVYCGYFNFFFFFFPSPPFLLFFFPPFFFQDPGALTNDQKREMLSALRTAERKILEYGKERKKLREEISDLTRHNERLAIKLQQLVWKRIYFFLFLFFLLYIYIYICLHIVVCDYFEPL
jgi:hypothetical protein